MLEKLGDQILYLSGVSSFLQFCPNFRLVYQKVLNRFFSDPRSRNDQRPQGNLRANFETSIEF